MKIDEPAPHGGPPLVSITTYDSSGRQASTQRGSDAPRLTIFEDLSGSPWDRVLTGQDANASGDLEKAGVDPIAFSETRFLLDGGFLWQEEKSGVYPELQSATPVTLSTSLRVVGSVSGLYPQRSKTMDANGNIATSESFSDRANAVVSNRAYAVGVAQPSTSKRRGGTSVAIAPATQTRTNFADALGRSVKSVHSVLGTNITVYGANHRLAETIDAFGASTSYGYYPEGTLRASTNALGGTSFYLYDVRGNVLRQWGSAGYPVSYQFNGHNELVEMRTYRDSSNFWEDFTLAGPLPSGDPTIWERDGSTGSVTGKVDAVGARVKFQYTPEGRLDIRTWARLVDGQPLTTDYNYNNLGRLTQKDYSDTTPDISFQYTRMGQISNVVDAVGTHAYAYRPDFQVATETTTQPSGVSTTLTRKYEDATGVPGRAAGLSNDQGYDLDYGYDPLGRLKTVTHGLNEHEYIYSPTSRQLLSRHNGATALSRTTNYDRGRIKSVLNQPQQLPLPDHLDSHAYEHDALGRRTSVAQDPNAEFAGRKWDYGYDAKSQVVAATNKWIASGAAVSGLGYQYDFDNIGNRISSQREADITQYTPNSLNQYASRTVPDGVHLVGAVTDPLNDLDSLKVNGQETTRTPWQNGSELFHARVPVDNAASGQFTDFTAEAKGGGGRSSTNNFGGTFTPQTPETFTYDADGNLTSDGRFTYFWDAENRLAKLVGKFQDVPSSLTVYTYDYVGRRTHKSVAGKEEDTSLYFRYDGWNLIQEVQTAEGGGTNSYVWGLDLSGTLQRAGGVGGLLSCNNDGSDNYSASDAIGNISLVVSSEGGVEATYGYDPFGQLITVRGVAPVFGFSSKYMDTETGFLYFGFRYYSPSQGRWLGRDPAEDIVNLYCMVGNSPLDNYDYLGLLTGHHVAAGACVCDTCEIDLTTIDNIKVFIKLKNHLSERKHDYKLDLTDILPSIPEMTINSLRSHEATIASIVARKFLLKSFSGQFFNKLSVALSASMTGMNAADTVTLTDPEIGFYWKQRYKYRRCKKRFGGLLKNSWSFWDRESVKVQHTVHTIDISGKAPYWMVTQEGSYDQIRYGLDGITRNLGSAVTTTAMTAAAKAAVDRDLPKKCKTRVWLP